MKVIYEPRGAAREYAPLAANLYRGCSHACRYCYAPACLRMDPGAFAHAAPRTEVLRHLAVDAARLRGEAGPVLLSFTHDPWQPCEREHRLTRGALAILTRVGIGVRTLTKAPLRALEDDGAALVAADAEFGVSLSWTDDSLRAQWEPLTEGVSDREAALRRARAMGLRTWLSVEPVIDVDEALGVIERLSGWVDMVKVGKLNHDRALESACDWGRLVEESESIFRTTHQAYYLKADLVRAVGRRPVHA
jgi:DNA repair photolyase